MTFLSGLVLFIAAILGGGLNSVAGGGSFITFPSLIFSGVPPIQANATSTVALWPGSLASVGAYRKELAAQNRVLMLVLGGTSLVGGVLGAILLLRTPQATFVGLIPYLMLLATLLFAFSPLITARLRKREYPSQKSAISWRALTGISLIQLVIATYGGYFGGGIGIMILASLGLMGMENIHEMNGLKTVLQSSINGVAVITFIIAGAVFWLQAIVMVLGAIVGGFFGASLARRLDPRLVRGFVILVGTGMTIYFFLK
jgi:uncharacterized protein